jgi:serine protease Do
VSFTGHRMKMASRSYGKLSVLLVLVFWTHTAPAQNRPSRLSEDLFTSGSTTLRAFSPIAESARHSIVELALEGERAALGTVIDASGFVLTKFSEVKEGKLIARLPGGEEVEAQLVASDDLNDVALLRITSTALKPIEWAAEDAAIGQWAITAGLNEIPEAVGVISAAPRKILHKRALIGVALDPNASAPRIDDVTTGMGAQRAGLKSGDVILAVNETPVNRRQDLIEQLRRFRDGQSVTLRVQRGEQEFQTEVTMMEAPPEEPGQSDGRGRMTRLEGELSRRAEGFDLALQHDSVLHPWHCGGPLLNLEGKAIGMNIARAGRVASYALPAGLVKQLAEKLQAEAQTQAHPDTTETSKQSGQ